MLSQNGQGLPPMPNSSGAMAPSMGGMNPVAQQLENLTRQAAADALNAFMMEVYRLSQIEVPKSGVAAEHNRHGQTLAESGHYPGNDPACKATPYARQARNPLGQFMAPTEDYLVASVYYDHPAATSQHEGRMVYERGGKPVEWEVRRYTTEGTKAHYLSDPLKALIPKLPIEISLWIQRKLTTGEASLIAAQEKSYGKRP